jgi:hypothetical protein
VLTTFSSNGWSSAGVACLVGISAPIGDLIGADSSVHLSEVSDYNQTFTSTCTDHAFSCCPGAEECVVDIASLDDRYGGHELSSRLRHHW